MKTTVALLLLVVAITAVSARINHELVGTSPVHEVFDDTRHSCQGKQFVKCANKYFRHFGFKRAPRNAISYLEKLLKYYHSNGKKSYDGLCRWINEFDQCTRSIGGDSCFDLKYFIHKLRLPYKDSIIFIQQHAKLQFECVADNKRELLKDWDCIITTAHHHMRQAGECGRALERAVKAHPKLICKFTDIFDRCVALPYSGCGYPAKKLVCNDAHVLIKSLVPQCESHCQRHDDDSLEAPDRSYEDLMPELQVIEMQADDVSVSDEDRDVDVSARSDSATFSDELSI